MWVTRSVAVAVRYRPVCVWACVTSSDIIPCRIMGYNTMERRCGQYSVTNCRMLLRCWVNIGVMFPPLIRWVDLRRSMCRPSTIFDVSTFKDRCVDLRRSMCRTFRDRCVDLRRLMCRTFRNRCVDLGRSMIDVSTFEDACPYYLICTFKIMILLV